MRHDPDFRLPRSALRPLRAAPLAMPIQRLEGRREPVRHKPVATTALARGDRTTVMVRRGAMVFGCIALAVATMVALGSFAGDEPSAFLTLRLVLVGLLTFGLAWTGMLVVSGVFATDEPRPEADLPDALTAVVIPAFNEDAEAMARSIRAMAHGLGRIGASQSFEFVLLSDTADAGLAAHEHLVLERLAGEPQLRGRLRYRRRPDNIGKKAGNLADFVRRSGAAYRYAVILDADSMMKAETLVTLVRRMEADSRLGLIQTVPVIAGAQSLFGRILQFASAYFGPAFSRGVASLQGDEGPFWGHNAIIRVGAFAQSCGLPRLSGQPPLGGDILSHDFVEAVLLAKHGWQVRLDPDLDGSYEGAPENLVDFLKRDRRWCQGNLQHGRLVGVPGLRSWGQFTLMQGLMNYLASPVLAAFLLTTVAAAFLAGGGSATPTPWVVTVAILALLLMPRLLIVVSGIGGRNRQFGGTPRVVLNVGLEFVLSAIAAPVLLAFQVRAVGEIVLGKDAGWPALSRVGRPIGAAEAWSASLWVVVAGAALLGLATMAELGTAVWMLPVAAPLLAAPLVLVASATVAPWVAAAFETPQDPAVAAVLLRTGAKAAATADMDEAVRVAAPAAPAATAT